jgi:hypothetical protein
MATKSKLEPYHHYPVTRIFLDSIDFGDTPVLDAVQADGTESEWVSCEGKSIVGVSPEYSGSNVTASIRIVFKGRNTDAKRIYSDSIGVRNTGRTSDDISTPAWYHGRGEYAFTWGATAFKILLDSVPTNSGFITVFAGAI